MEYNLRRERPKVNYKALLEEKLPKLTGGRASRQTDRLYPVEVVETDGSKVKIHYVGYADKYDEWREAEEVESPDTSVCEQRSEEAERYSPFDPHRELAIQIKASLNCGNRKNVDVRLDMPFDRLLFNGGLKQKAVHLRSSRGHNIYGIKHYSDLDGLLGKGWYMRALNPRLDFCYVNRETVQFYLHERKPLVEYDADGKKKLMNCGTSLVFRFIRMDAVQRQWQEVSLLS